MSERLLHVIVRDEDAEAVMGCFDDLPAEARFALPGTGEDGRQMIVAALHDVDSQEVLDKIGTAMKGRENWQLYLLPTEAFLPEAEDEELVERQARRETANAREEIYGDVRGGAALTVDYLVLTVLATLVAAIGLIRGDVSIVIGAMVIAPLLGPILAFSFATTLGNTQLLKISLRTMGAGLGVATITGVAIGLLLGGAKSEGMLAYSSVLSLTTVALPLASGAAAALMISAGQASALVGVMVAAALLPPLAGMGLLLAGGAWGAALRALALVVVNIAAINLAAQAVFLWKGIRPKRWGSDDRQTSPTIALGVSGGVVAALALALWLAQHGWMF